MFLQFPDRFMVGTDSYTPERCTTSRATPTGRACWLADLPREVAERIAWKNGEQALSIACAVLSFPAWACNEGTRLESPRYVLAYKAEALAIAKHFSVDGPSARRRGSRKPKR